MRRRGLSAGAASRLVLLALVAAGLLQGPALRTRAAGAPVPDAAALAHLDRVLEADVAGQPQGTLSICYRDLHSGAAVDLNAEQTWDPASVVKLFVMAEAYRRRAAGSLDFNRPVRVAAANVVPTVGFSDGQYPGLVAGMTVSVGTLMAMMTTQSDNTAYNTLLDLLGRDAVAAYARSLGLQHTTVARKLNLEGAAGAVDSALAGGRANVTTAADVAQFYLLLYHDELPLSDLMLRLLARQKQNYMLPAELPAGTVVAHKPGEVDDTLRHDGGIVYLPGGGAFVLVVFSALGSYAEVAHIAGQVAAVYPTAAGPPGSLTAPADGRLPGLLRLLLELAGGALLLLVFGLDRGLVGRRARPRRSAPPG